MVRALTIPYNAYILDVDIIKRPLKKYPSDRVMFFLIKS